MRKSGISCGTAGTDAFHINGQAGRLGIDGQGFIRLVYVKVIQPGDVADVIAITVIRAASLAVKTMSRTELTNVFSGFLQVHV
ncbi:hypothetical protein AO354_40440 [Pseudomonas syringae pv. syringae]|nr:hypothetical protein AO354_40440 [Pseudomonas syringae pv. syringae]